MPVDETVIDRPVEQGARLVALGLLAECDGAAERLAQGKDPEALHDFRVGLRRLRSTLRAFGPWLAGVPAKSTDRLRKIARSTNAARDAEVQLAWLAKERERLGRRRPLGIDFLAERYRARIEGENGQAELLARYARVSARLSRRLSTYESEVAEAKGSGSFGGVLASLLAEHLEALRRRTAEIRGASDEEHVHEARIAAKRLRYLLEPLRGNRHADGREAVGHLKSLQDVLGELHDCHVLAREISAALVDCETARARQRYAALHEDGPGSHPRERFPPGPRSGLLALAGTVRARRDALFSEVGQASLTDDLRGLAGEVKALVGALEARAGGRFELKRTYLLSAVPPRVQGALPFEVAQGLLPGVLLRERITRVRGPDGERFWRGLEQGGPRREAEEETTREVFEALWPLTLGRRLEKQRWRLEEEGLTLDVDRFLDRELVLAELLLPAGAEEPQLPAWLLPHVVREVTEEPWYAGEGLVTSIAGAGPSSAGGESGARGPTGSRGPAVPRGRRRGRRAER